MNDKIREVPGWKDCPVPVCYGGDLRAITFCCHPKYPLEFNTICRRGEILKKIELTNEKFIEIKERFSEEVGWKDTRLCFKSLAYCCLRRNGCPAERDTVLKKLYGDDYSKTFKEYILLKRVLTIRLLKQANEKAKSFLKKRGR